MAYYNCCEHPPAALREHIEGTTCTVCGIVVDSLVFDQQPAFVEYVPLHGPPRPSPRNSSAAAFVHREEKRTYVDTKLVATFVATMRLNDALLETAKEIYSDALKAKQASGGFRGVALEAAAASAVYYACKVEGVDRTEGEVASNCNVNLATLAATNKVVRRLLSKKAYALKILAPIKPSALVPRFIAAMCEAPAIIHSSMVQAVRMRLTSLTNAAESARTLEGKTPECACISLMVLAILQVVPDSERKDISKRCADRARLSVGAILTAVKAFEQQRVAT